MLVSLTFTWKTGFIDISIFLREVMLALYYEEYNRRIVCNNYINEHYE